MTTHRCEYCDYQTTNRHHFNMHVTSQRHVDIICKQPKDTVLVCLRCNDYSSTIKFCFRRHIESCKSKQKGYKCTACGKLFKINASLLKHESTCTVLVSSSLLKKIEQNLNDIPSAEQIASELAKALNVT